MSTLETISLVSAIAAILAVIVGPSVQLAIAKRQIRATTVSSSRQQWIHQLREEMTRFLGTAMYFSLVVSDSRDRQAEMSLIREILTSQTKIELLVNPREELFVSALHIIEQIVACITAIPRREPSELQAHVDRLVAKSQQIFKTEWERVKTGT